MQPEKNTQPSERVVTRMVSDRWTEKLAKTGWAPICHAFLDLYRQLPEPLTTTEAMVVIMLIRHKWDNRLPFPSLKRLGRMMGLGITSMRNYMQSLEAKKYLLRVRRSGRSNAFDLTTLFEALEATMDRVAREKTATRTQAMEPL